MDKGLLPICWGALAELGLGKTEFGSSRSVPRPLGRCAAEVPPLACARSNGMRAWHEPEEIGQARQPSPGAVEITPARVHRRAIRKRFGKERPDAVRTI